MPILVDQNREPKLYYHGTRRAFEKFKPNEIGLIHFSDVKTSITKAPKPKRAPDTDALALLRIKSCTR